MPSQYVPEDSRRLIGGGVPNIMILGHWHNANTCLSVTSILYRQVASNHKRIPNERNYAENRRLIIEIQAKRIGEIQA